MRQLTVELKERSYSIYIKSGLLADGELIARHCQGDKILIVTNDTLEKIFLDKLLATLSQFKVNVVCLPDGEKYKSLSSFELIIDQLIKNGFHRNDCIIALGGGVIGDITGFAAACYQRGMNFIQIPTSLLAQVDSSVGGKTAVNHPDGKNMIGTFYQPSLVLIDPQCLDSLPHREFISGLAEIVKYAMLGEERIESILQLHSEQILQKDQTLLGELIYLSCRKKAQFVVSDEQEQGERALLNLGHSFGHALERLTEYQGYLHGEAVAIGIGMAINLSRQLSLLSAQTAHKWENLLSRFGLPETCTENYSVEDFLSAMQLDKKNRNTNFRLVLPTEKGCVIKELSDCDSLRSAIQAKFKSAHKPE